MTTVTIPPLYDDGAAAQQIKRTQAVQSLTRWAIILTAMFAIATVSLRGFIAVLTATELDLSILGTLLGLGG